MRFTFFFLLATTLSCQDINSNSRDRVLYGGDGNLIGSPGFAPAYAILQDKCTSCHTQYHANWGGFTNEQQWIDEGLVVPADANSSFLITKIINAGGNMPLGMGPLPSDEYDTLVDWINDIP